MQAMNSNQDYNLKPYVAGKYVLYYTVRFWEWCRTRYFNCKMYMSEFKGNNCDWL